MLNDDVVKSIESSVLCWLATVSAHGEPNVSPKEAFTHDSGGKLLIAHIASPGSVANIRSNSTVCVSFIDVFVQKGYKVKGTARVLETDDRDHDLQRSRLVAVTGKRFPIRSVIEVTPTKVEPITAPSYVLFPDTTEQDMVRQSVVSYRVKQYLTE